MSETFIVTFGAQYAYKPHPLLDVAHPDDWMVVIAKNYRDARIAVTDELEIYWSMLYTEAEFEQYKSMWSGKEVHRIVTEASGEQA